MATSKKEFKWDVEELVGTVELSEYEKRETRICELKGKEYVVFTTLKKIKEVWCPTGGYSIPKEKWSEIVGFIGGPAAKTKTKKPAAKTIRGGAKK